MYFFIPFSPHLYQINSNDMTEKKLWVDIHTYCMNTNIICTRSWVRTLYKQVFFRNFIHIFLVTSPDTEALFIVPYTPSHNLLSLLCKWRGDAMRFGGWGGCPALQRKQHSCPVRIWHILAAQGTTSWPTWFTVSNCQVENPHV